jgi:hypothetical protein
MGFMSGFFGSAATGFEESRQRNEERKSREQIAREELANRQGITKAEIASREAMNTAQLEMQERLEARNRELRELQLSLDSRRLTADEVQNYYANATQSWGTMTAAERLQARNSLQALGQGQAIPAIDAYLGLFDAQIRTGMNSEQAKLYLANLVTTPPNVDNPYDLVPQWIVDQALSVLEASGDEDFDAIKADVEGRLAQRQDDLESIITPGFWTRYALETERQQGANILTGAQTDNVRAQTTRILQDIDITEEQRDIVLRQLEATATLAEGNVFAQSVSNGFLEERQRAELDNILFQNTALQNNARLFEATFDSVVREAAARADLTESEARVLLATEGLEIALKEGQVAQVDVLLRKMESEIENLDANTQRVLLDNSITQETKASLVILAQQRARLATSEANVAARTEEAEVTSALANARRAVANASMDELRADQYGQELAANLAQVAAATGNSIADLRLKNATFDSAVSRYAAESNIAESTARVYLATEAFRVSAASLEPEMMQAQIANFWANVEMTNAQADLVLPKMMADLIVAGDSATLSVFGESLLQPRFGNNWQNVLSTITAAADNSAGVEALKTNVELAYRRALTDNVVSSTAVNRASLTPTSPAVTDVFRDVNGSGFSSVRQILDMNSEAFSLGDSITSLTAILQRGGDIEEALASSLPVILDTLGLDPNVFGEISREAAMVVLEQAKRRLDSMFERNSSELSVYMQAAAAAGIPLDPSLFGFDVRSEAQMLLWNQARYLQPDTQTSIQEGLIWESQYGEDLTAAIAPLQTLYVPTLYHNAQGLTDYDSLMAPIVEELRLSMGEQAWAAAGSPTGRELYNTFMVPELERYESVYESINRDKLSLSQIGIDFNIDDRQSVRDAIQQINSRSRALEALDAEALRRSVAGWDWRYAAANVASLGNLARRDDSQLAADVLRTLGLPQEYFIQRGVTDGSQDVDFNRLLEVTGEFLDLMSSASNSMSELSSRYMR